MRVGPSTGVAGGETPPAEYGATTDAVRSVSTGLKPMATVRPPSIIPRSGDARRNAARGWLRDLLDGLARLERAGDVRGTVDVDLLAGLRPPRPAPSTAAPAVNPHRRRPEGGPGAQSVTWIRTRVASG